jgi:hypothetical protein
MTVDFWDFFEQFRYITATLVILYLFSVHAAHERSHFKLRLLIGYCIGLLGAFAFLWIEPLISITNISWALIMVPYWLGMHFISIAIILFCFDMSVGSAFFRGTIALTVEGIATTIVRYLMVMMWFPKMPEEHPVIYITMVLVVYFVLYYAGYHIIAAKMQREDGETYFTRCNVAVTYIIAYVSYIVIISAVQVVCEMIITPLSENGIYFGIYYVIEYLCVASMLLISLGMMIILYHTYENVVLQKERELLEQLLREKKTQYEFIKENTDLINKKCHELKHQLRELETVEDNERNNMIRSISNAINFYDASVKTGNEVLDTILTEKSVLCAGRGIKLSCMVNSNELSHIQVIDLYTMLDNALGNAVENVTELEDKEKKLISFMVTTIGKMIYISVENYYEGEIHLKRGYPVDGRKDKNKQGYRIRSISMLARRYGGDIKVNIENQIFQLQIILPV